MNSPLDKQYTFPTLILFSLPNIIMMIFLSLYTIVDGIFVSRFVGTTALSAVNMVYPLVCIEMAVGIMLATGGSAVIAKKLGERRDDEARGDFSLLVLISALVGVVMAVLGLLFLDEIVLALGSSEDQFELCRSYGGIILAFSPCFFLQTAFQTFFVTAGRPVLGLFTTVAAGIANIVLDYLFIAVFDMGIAGAALATGIGYCIPAVAGLLFFALARKNSLHFVRPSADGKMLLAACANGSSEMVTNLANAVTTFLFNIVFMRFYGEDGVAAITIVLYFQFVFTAIHFGYAMGIAPIVSYKYGAGDVPQLKKVFNCSLVFLSVASVASFALSLLVLEPALTIFTDPAANVFALTMEGFPIFAVGFLFMGVSIFASALFTAFSDGKVSAIISFARTFVFLVGAVLLLPLILDKSGVWLAVPVAEALGAVVSVAYLIAKKRKYNY
ncbi:MAG: MATE family efflux transporter [Oscillospiraceae bacterium]